MVIVIRVQTDPQSRKASDHADIIISDITSYLRNRYNRTEVVGVEWRVS